jgi:hypothetical protein
VIGLAVRFPSSLPGASVILAQIGLAAGLWTQLVFISGSNQLRFEFEGGGGADGPVVTTDTWYYVELSVDVSANPNVIAWQVDGSAQTGANQGQAATSISTISLGTTNSETMTVRYDDVIVLTDTSAITFPIGPHKVEVLTVDAGATWTLTGTAANFSTFTANGTLDTSFTVTEARDRTDEWPPTVGAAADGWVQDAVAASDFLSSPMTSYTLGGGETVAGLRALVCGWATSTSGTNIRLDAFNGTTAETFFSLADPNFDNSTTNPAWVCRMLTTANYDTQGELDALALQGGWGTDANPDCGVHAWAVELAIQVGTGDATATPAVIARGVALPAAGAAVTAGPAVTAAPAALPNAARNITAGPAVTAATAALPSAARNISVGPAAAAVVVALPQVVAGQHETVTPAATAALAALARPAATVQAGPAPVASVATLARPAATITASPAVLAAVAAVPQATPQAGGSATVTPDAVAAVAALARASVAVAAGPVVLAALADVPFGIGANATVGPAVVALLSTLGQATPQAGGSTTATPATVAAVAALGQATALFDFTVSPAVVAALAALARPAVAVGASPAVLSAVAALGAPQVGVRASPAVLAALAALPTPTVGVITSATPATVAAVAALARAAVNVTAGPLVIARAAAIPQAQPGQWVTVAPATIARAVTIPQAGAAVGASPAVIALAVILPLIANAGGEPVPGGGTSYVGALPGAVYVGYVPGTVFIGEPAGEG